MSDEFFDDLANADTADGRANPFKPGRGTLIVKDVKMFYSSKAWKLKKQKNRVFVFEGVVKESFPVDGGEAPNAPGTTVSIVRQLDATEYPDMAKTAMQKVILAIFGPAAATLTKEKKVERTKWLLRVGGTDQPELQRGVTVRGQPCPARGYEVKYETVPDAKGKFWPEITAGETLTEEQVKANLKLIGG